MFVNPRVRLAFVLTYFAFSLGASAQTPEYRASWADAFHTGFMSAGELTTTVNNLRNGNVNVFVPEVYVNSGSQLIYWNPTASEYVDRGAAATIVSNGVPITCDLDSDPQTNSAGAFDPLAESIRQCHDTTGGKARLDVWAWMVSFRSAGPLRSNHPGWITVNTDASTQTDFDPGHPGAEQQLVNTCLDIVEHYDVDGLNFDYIRFTNVNNGFNPVSIARYKAITGNADPGADDAAFKQWRRDQITNVVRKIYLSVIAVKPNVKISGDTITWYPSPARPNSGDPNPLQTWKANFANTRPYYEVYQDWRSWMEEGIIDIAMPMAYLTECSYKSTYDKWCDFTKDNQFGRQCVIGPGGYLNSMTDALAQYARTRNPSSTMGKYGAGQNNYSYAVPYALTCGGTQQADPVGWLNALKAGMYAQPATVPALPRLSNGKGHIKGTVVSALVAAPGWVDGGTVTLSANANGTNPLRTMQTDGTGFYGFVDVAPGSYYIKVHAKNNGDQIKPVIVTATTVSTVDFTLSGLLPATQLAFSVQPGGAATAVAFTSQPVVMAKDATGVIVTGFTGPVTLAIKAGTGASGAALVGTATVTAINGVATFSGLSINRPGSGYVLTASSGDLTLADSGAFTVAVVPTHLVFNQQPAGASPSVPFTTQPVVTAMDEFGNPAPAFTGAITLQIKPGTGTAGAALTGNFIKTPVNGVATFSGLAINKAGAGYVLRATASGLTAAESESFSIEAVATRLAFSASPAGVLVGQLLLPSPLVIATDDDGVQASSLSSPVTISIKDGTGIPGASLLGTLIKNPANGIAMFDDLSIDKVGFGYRLHATSGSLTPADSYAFDIRTRAVNLAFSTQPGGAKAGGPFARQPVVVAQNAAGETATDYEGPVFIGIKDGTGPVTAWLDGNTSLNMVKGVAAFTDLLIDTPGTGYVLSVTSSPLPLIDSAPFDVVDSGPYSIADAIRAAGIAGGLVVATNGDPVRLDIDGTAGVDLLDATRIARKVAGLEPNP